MGKNTNFTGQSILNQLLFYIRGVNIKRIAKKYDAERYVKKFETRQHLIVMLFGVIDWNIKTNHQQNPVPVLKLKLSFVQRLHRFTQRNTITNYELRMKIQFPAEDAEIRRKTQNTFVHRFTQISTD